MRIYRPDPSLKDEDFKGDMERSIAMVHMKLKKKIVSYVNNNPGCRIEDLFHEFFDWATNTIRNYVTDLMKQDIIISKPDPEDNRMANYYVLGKIEELDS